MNIIEPRSILSNGMLTHSAEVLQRTADEARAAFRKSGHREWQLQNFKLIEPGRQHGLTRWNGFRLRTDLSGPP